jgi:hypothetical protein
MRPQGTERRGMRRTPRRLIGILIAAAALLVAGPASAQAAFTVTGSVTTNANAGAHSDVHIHVGFAQGQVKDLTIGLPPGMVGDPNATPLCSVAQLNADACSTNTKVGSVTANATVTVAGPVTVPVTVNGDLYNLTPQPGEPARFGIVLRPLALPPPLPSVLPNIILQSGVQLRPDFGLDTIINNIPNSTSGFSTTINSQDITLFGTAPGTGKPFMRNPTSCGNHTTNFSAVAYNDESDTASATFPTNNCGALDFSPAFTAIVGGPGGTAQGGQTTAITSIDQDNDEAGLINAHVFVPPDLAPNTLTDLLSHRCPPADFQAGTCLGNTVVGNAIATSPLLSQGLAGQVFLVDNGGLLPNIGLDLRGQLHLLLQGSLNVDKSVTFGDLPPGLPDIPISHFQLSFTNPPGLLIANRDLCVGPPPVFHADFMGYNGANTSVDSPASVQGCGAGSGTGGNAAKCKKAKKKRKHRAAESKKHKKRSCKKKQKKKHH